MNIKLKDIAKELGVTVSTVSKAINNRPGVSENLRKKIIQAVNEKDTPLKYKIDYEGRKDILNINLLIRINMSIENDPFYSFIVEGISKELQSCKCNLLYHVLHENKINDNQFNEIFLEKKTDGNIIVGADYDPGFFDRLKRTGITTVLVDNIDPDFSSVNTDNYGGAVQAARHLIDLGHENIVFISGPLLQNSILERYRGYCDCLKEHLQHAKPQLIECPGVSIEDGYNAAKIYQKNEFTAVFCATDKLAIGAMKALKEKNLNIPEDVSIIGFDDIGWGLHTEPSLSTMRVAKQQAGVLAAQLFMTNYNQPENHKVDIKISTNLIRRDSTGPLPHR